MIKKPKVAFFDLNNTCLQMDGVPKGDIIEYLNHIHSSSWHPLRLPEYWGRLKAWDDVDPALDEMVSMLGIKTVTLSNNPIALQIEQSHNNCLAWDFLVPLESYHVFKPDVKAYQVACNLLQVAPEDALMVTANKDFGDLEGAATIGMPSVWIDRKNEDPMYSIKNLMDLVKVLQ